MKPVTINKDSQAIVYDADVLPGAGIDLFDPEHWRARGLLSGSAPGRGTTCFLDAPFGPAALRRYLRGGWAAKISRETYFFTGVESSRSFREFHLLAAMAQAGLRVPRPIAALCARSGPGYRAALLTARIQPARTLPERFLDPNLDWTRLGHELRAFHDAGMDHADLNARNILVHDETGEAWLLDFDRCSFDPARPVDGSQNLARLERSLVKLWPPGDLTREQHWGELKDGYLA